MARLPRISIEEKPAEYSTVDCSYFEAGKTPKFLWISFSGILPAENWPVLGNEYPPPNGTWKLEHTAENFWTYVTEKVSLFYAYIDSKFFVNFTYYKDEVGYSVFYKFSDEWPYHASANLYDFYDESSFYKGYFQASWIPETGSASVGAVAESVGIERAAKTFYQGIADSNTEGIYQFARRIDKTCIRVKVEKPQ